MSVGRADWVVTAQLPASVSQAKPCGQVCVCAMRLQHPHGLQIKRMRCAPEWCRAVVVKAGRHQYRSREFDVPKMLAEADIDVRACGSICNMAEATRVKSAFGIRRTAGTMPTPTGVKDAGFIPSARKTLSASAH